MAAPDLSNVPAEDLQHIANGDLSKVSDAVLHHIAGVPQPAVKMGENPSALSEYGGAAAKVLGGAVRDIPDALASGVSHVASSVLAPPAALAARTGAAITGNSPTAAANAVHNFIDTTGTYHAQTPGGQALENDAGAAGRVVSAPFASAAGAVERAAGPTAAQHIENTAGLANDVVGSIPALAAGKGAIAAARAPAAMQVARGAGDVAQEAGYTGLKTRADLKTPGAQKITDALIAQDAGVVPGSAINIDAVRNGRAVGPARVYNRMESSMPTSLKQDTTLQGDLKSLGDSTSQLPKSPDVDALRSAMLNQPEMTSKELFSNIREARSRAAAALASDDPDKAALGKAYGQLANAYEDFAGRNIPVQSDISLPQWQAARTQFAKSFLAEEALKGGEHFDASVYGRAAQHDPGLLTGGGKVVADIHNALPAGGSDAVPRGVGAAVGGLLGAGAEHAAGAGFGMGGASGAVIGSQAAPAVRGAIRNVATRGNPAAAAAAPTNPRLSYVYDASRPEAPAPTLALNPPEGTTGKPAPSQLGMQLAQGRPELQLAAQEEHPYGLFDTPSVVERRNNPFPQGELNLPPGREPVQLGDQIVRQQRLAAEGGVRSPPREADIRGSEPPGKEPTGPSPPAQPTPFAGKQPREGMLPERLKEFIEALRARHGR